MKILTTKFARSVFYILFIGGLFISQAIMLSILWTLVGKEIFGSFSLNILEAGGIVALSYVVYFGIRFGIKHEPDSLSSEKTTIHQHNDNLSGSRTIEVVRQLSKQEKCALKIALNSICNGKSKTDEFPEGSQVRI